MRLDFNEWVQKIAPVPFEQGLQTLSQRIDDAVWYEKASRADDGSVPWDHPSPERCPDVLADIVSGKRDKYGDPPLSDIVGEVYRDSQGRLHCENGPALSVQTVLWDNPQYGEFGAETTSFYVIHGELTAAVDIYSGADCEGSGYKEEWFNAAGQRHRADGPALIESHNHRIPEETHLDESIQEDWTNGEMIEHRDTTYEDIIFHKDINIRQHFGYDLDC